MFTLHLKGGTDCYEKNVIPLDGTERRNGTQ